MSHRRTGIDQRGETLYTASARDDSGRTLIDRLERVQGPIGERRDLMEQATVGLAVPDHLVMVKRLLLESSFVGSLRDRVHFELAQSLLEEEDEFHFDYFSVDGQNRYLGVIIRREHLAQMIDDHNLRSLHDDHRLTFQARAAALGRGYLIFCPDQDSDLAALVDLAGATASVCFVYQRRIVDMVALPVWGDLAGEIGRERFAVELKTLVNFQLASLFGSGVSVPLSRVLLNGEYVNDALIASVQKYFPVEVGRPRIHEGYLCTSSDSVRDDLSLYLVALGLTVN